MTDVKPRNVCEATTDLLLDARGATNSRIDKEMIQDVAKAGVRFNHVPTMMALCVITSVSKVGAP